jgi:GNAT superfamily N-acetyltransferase/RimJ/RimL family protein N-acetyltransferase
VDLHRLDPADRDAVQRVHELFELVRAAETPELEPLAPGRYAAFLEHPPPYSEFRCHTAVEDGALAGLVWVHLPLKDNTHYAEAELLVHPGRRRRGVGSALLARLLDLAREERRSELVVIARAAVEGGPGRSDTGAKFLERRGFTRALTEIDRRLDIGAIDPAAEERLWDEAVAASGDYEAVSWTGRCPDEYLEGLGRIDSMIFAEIPLGDVDLRPLVVDPQFVRAREDRAEAQGNAVIRTIAVHKGSGDLAANTVIHVHRDETHAGQSITIVDPAHRGHRLGLLVKLANLRRLREARPDVTAIWAGNADTNANMTAINDLLGFRPVDARVSYKRRLDV